MRLSTGCEGGGVMGESGLSKLLVLLCLDPGSLRQGGCGCGFVCELLHCGVKVTEK